MLNVDDRTVHTDSVMENVSGCIQRRQYFFRSVYAIGASASMGFAIFAIKELATVRYNLENEEYGGPKVVIITGLIICCAVPCCLKCFKVAYDLMSDSETYQQPASNV